MARMEKRSEQTPIEGLKVIKIQSGARIKKCHNLLREMGF